MNQYMLLSLSGSTCHRFWSVSLPTRAAQLLVQTEKNGESLTHTARSGDQGAGHLQGLQFYLHVGL